MNEIEDKFTFLVMCAEKMLHVVHGSPNGDGNNDTFYPALGSNAWKVISFNVYDRWGGEVYADPGLPDPDLPGWDGAYKGEAMDSGTYLYDAQIEFNNGKTRRFAGVVNLMR